MNCFDRRNRTTNGKTRIKKKNKKTKIKLPSLEVRINSLEMVQVMMKK